MDFIQRGISDEYGLRFIYVDVSGTSDVLAQRHLDGPAAGEILSQALASVALLSSDLDNEDECVSIQWMLNGPIQGVLVEAAYGGRLRGYTYRKTLPEFDGNEDIDFSEVLGTEGDMVVLQSVPGNLVYSGRVSATPPDIARNLARYYNQSRQTPTGVELVVRRDVERIRHCVGLVAQKLPDGDTEKFVEVLEAFSNGLVRERLSVDTDLIQLAKTFAIGDLLIVDQGELRFECRCSDQKILQVLMALPEQDLREMAEADEPQSMTCHFCGETYPLGQRMLERIIEQRRE